MDPAKVRKMLVIDEGLRLKPYKCTAGKTTIGIGRNLSDVGISKETAYQMLDEDIKRSESDCIAIFGKELWDKWSENRRIGWINIAFNIGLTRLLFFKNTLRYAMAGNWTMVDAGFRDSLYARQVGKRAERVIAMICKEQFPYE